MKTQIPIRFSTVSLVAFAVLSNIRTASAATSDDVFSSVGGSVIALAGGLEPSRDGTGERLVVVTSGWTDLDQSVASGDWQAAAAREILWDEGGTVGAVSWEPTAYDPESAAAFAVRVAPAGSARTLRMGNISGRAGLRQVNGSVITGFAFNGAPRRFLVRAAGPALGAFGISQPMANPSVTVFDAARQPIATSLDWDTNGAGDEIAQVASDLWAFPFERGSADAALLIELSAGAYTVVVGSENGDEGVTLAEAYAVPEAGADAGVGNLSLRARVEPGERAVIPGFITEGDSNRRYLIRVVGPGLMPFGVTSPLADPRLTVYQGNKPVATNDNWSESLAADAIEQAAAQVYAFGIDRSGKDSAVLMALPPGLFTVVVDDATGSGAQGEVLVEVYLVPTE